MLFTNTAQIAWAFTLAMVAMLAAGPGENQGQRNNALPSFAEIEACVRRSFAEERGFQPQDLISKSQVTQALKALQQLGWDVPDQQGLLANVLDDQHILVRTFRSPDGKRFADKISGREMMIDRLDRIAGVFGGPELIRDIVKLPNGEKYAKPRSGGGVPDLLDLLPKGASGRTRRIKDYDKPTGHIYSVEGLIKALAETYAKTTAGTTAKTTVTNQVAP